MLTHRDPHFYLSQNLTNNDFGVILLVLKLKVGTKMNAIINLAWVLMPIWIMGLAIVIKDGF